MKYIGRLLAVTALMAVVALAWNSVGFGFGLPGIDVPDVAEHSVIIEQPAKAEVVSIEPIAIECLARINAVVPVKGIKEHKALGKVYRTDTVEMLAIGDVDTCVPIDSTTVRRTPAGVWVVTVDAALVDFNRPRVDTVASASSFRFNKGLFGKLTDAFPWVSENSELTPAAYAYAQVVIGGSACMQAAWESTQVVVTRAYKDIEAKRLGIDPALVTVEFIGAPLFNDSAPTVLGDGLIMSVDAIDTICQVAEGAETQSPTIVS